MPRKYENLNYLRYLSPYNAIYYSTINYLIGGTLKNVTKL